LTLKNLSLGLFIAFGELIIGSHGYLFSLDIGHGATLISIRLGIFIVVLLAFAIHILKSGIARYWQALKAFKFFKYYLFLAIAIVWGFVWGIIRGNDFGNVFLDFNNWLFFLYLLPLVSVAQDRQFWLSLKNIALACLLWLILKTLILFYIFSHQFLWAVPEAYQWVRDTRVGEITPFSGSFYRVFLQSQIYALLGFFVLLPLIKKIRVVRLQHLTNSVRAGGQTYYLLLVVVCLSTILISLSRSFWVGLIVGLFFYFILIFYELLIISRRETSYWLRDKVKSFSWSFFRLIVIIIFSFSLLFTIAYAPPPVSGNLASLFKDRATAVEAAGSSRVNMLLPLLQAIAHHPVIGSGFGTTVTYKSVDPRIVPATAGASGEFTTYAFEWGYLDLLLKIGLFGIFIYLLFIFKLLQTLWQRVKSQIPNCKSQINQKSAISNQQSAISNLPLGLLLALIALLIVNIFTPYLNHPLGIGFIITLSAWLDQNKTQN
jgi:O-antigen ligase